VNDDIGAGEKLKQAVTIARVPQVEPRATFAERHLRREAWFIPAWRVYAQHIGPEAC
jgi:hypothetical protein